MTEGLILASASIARAQLLAAAGLDFRVEPAVLDEASLKRARRADGDDAAGCALALAEAKARHVAARSNRALVIAADQILVCRQVWFDKPRTSGKLASSCKHCGVAGTSSSRQSVWFKTRHGCGML
jgi:septum formation protein